MAIARWSRDADDFLLVGNEEATDNLGGGSGAPLDGEADGRPFLAAPDRAGRRLPFIATWASASDSSGGVMARGDGPGADLIRRTIESSDIDRALYLGMFERRID